MQSGSYVHGVKDLASSEILPSDYAVAKSKNGLMGWDFKTANSSMIISAQQSFGEVSHELPNNSTRDRDGLSSEVEDGKMNTFMVNMNAYNSVDDDSTSRFSCSVVESNDKASYIDLKLGRFGDLTETQNSKISKGGSIQSSSESSKPTKRVRLGVNFHRARCQVYGCNKDLTSSKEYHRRHKVCEVHSKTSKVIVNGIEQRFCQQCSRFHLLTEFDDGKRSCRKRLAGHNERRRKPQVNIHSGRTGRLLQSCNGFTTSRYNGASFICEDLLPNVPLHLEKSGANNLYRHVKVEDGVDYSQLSSIPITNGHFHSKPVFTSNNSEKAFLDFHVNGAATPTTSSFNDRTNRYACDLTGLNTGSRSLMQDTSLGNEEFDNAFDPASNIQGLPGITNSGCALSLLSSQSHNFPSQLSGISVACPLLVPACSNHYSAGQVPKKLLGLSSQGSASEVSKKSSGTSSIDGNQFRSAAIMCNSSDAITFDATDAIYQGSNFMNCNDRLSCGDDTTIDLLELSSQLQRVEWQKQQVKQEHDGFYWPHIS